MKNAAIGDWVETTLGDVAKIASGATPSTKEVTYWGGDIAWITPKDLSSFKGVYITRGERNITEEGIRNSSAQMLPKNTVLFSSRAPIGYVAIAGNELTTNQGFKNIICDEKNTHYLFIYYWLKNNSNRIEKLSSGSTFSEASASLMRSLEIKLPPITEQKEIAGVLLSLDNKIELLRKQNKTLEATAQAIFNEWFEKGKELPKGWHLTQLKDVIELNPSEVVQKDGEIPYLDMSALPIQGSWTEKPLMRKFSSGSRFRNGDTLFARITPCLENGKTAFIQCLPEGVSAWGSTEFIVIRVKKPLPSEYGYLLARNTSFRNFAIKMMSGTSGRQRVQVEMLRGYPVVVPDKKTLDIFAGFVETCFRSIASNSLQMEQLGDIRDVLLPKLISGEVRVKEF
ncbi:MAG: Restriction modification system DNA specificity domain protein [Candidatus Wolfebacteria bacterium GW2011_GWC2_46_275]|uniref:Restriction modification system DNA specificity domain-containing protein, type I restriction enzyme, S subunit n=1 Tax=Candidatus Wolfebacteria bacterium GW2011_GWB1_47_1 TaxID=1619007 RepID=A0A0G4AR75_9BACT|nr:MAG: restriction modification system DNA specificity domain-containing protein, type I restriction enzyme, S subunit [Candidatus Wolfebacteria bacterium GW2011_GWB1_47_1]KKU36429.1 MAG: Restriction modification system DNA specificity domain protein [Candidatus Wolfebacteria bacterium GW2011_GWC2_46_275]KKU41742.1 MAG: Restriction modification system DNA specificity domain protein [Candidatus Wolfebacteria bacterium GW2011_GWB2_46_69]KKU53964.1 MAG: Restriction modification system DNA specific